VQAARALAAYMAAERGVKKVPPLVVRMRAAAMELARSRALEVLGEKPSVDPRRAYDATYVRQQRAKAARWEAAYKEAVSRFYPRALVEIERDLSASVYEALNYDRALPRVFGEIACGIRAMAYGIRAFADAIGAAVRRQREARRIAAARRVQRQRATENRLWWESYKRHIGVRDEELVDKLFEALEKTSADDAHEMRTQARAAYAIGQALFTLGSALGMTAKRRVFNAKAALEVLDRYAQLPGAYVMGDE
jgi:hypothetical protein